MLPRQHVWSPSSQHFVLSAQVALEDLAHWNTILNDLQRMLEHNHVINHVTLQRSR